MLLSSYQAVLERALAPQRPVGIRRSAPYAVPYAVVDGLREDAIHVYSVPDGQIGVAVIFLASSNDCGRKSGT